MANIDLVPDEYRYWTWQQRCLKRSGLIAGALTLLCALVWHFLHVDAARADEKLRILQAQKQVSQNQQQRLEYLSAQQSSLQRQWQLLLGLRGGATVENLFVAIDRALLGDQVWFDSWQFQRAGQELSEQQIAPERDRGAYIIILPDQAQASANTPSAWSIETHLSISGGADDHAALSAFVERLLRQPRVSDVKVLSTSLYSSSSDSSAIKFNISVLVNNAYGVDT